MSQYMGHNSYRQVMWWLFFSLGKSNFYSNVLIYVFISIFEIIFKKYIKGSPKQLFL